MIPNLFTLTGILYSKNLKKQPNKKDPSKPEWEFFSIKVEYKVTIGGRERTIIPELWLEPGVSYDGFEVGQEIAVDFYLLGKAINPTWYKTDAKVIYIKLINANGIASKVVEDKTFTPPNPASDDFDDSNLPF